MNVERLPVTEIRRAFAPHAQEYPPILSLQQAAKLAHVAPGTLKRLVSMGAFRHSVKRRRPLLFWRDYFVRDLMSSDRSSPDRGQRFN
jgi:hypothetical protein